MRFFFFLFTRHDNEPAHRSVYAHVDAHVCTHASAHGYRNMSVRMSIHMSTRTMRGTTLAPNQVSAVF